MRALSQPNLSEYASKLITFKSRRLVGRCGLNRSDRDDIEQELSLHVIEKIDQFDPKRGSQNTFVDRIVNRKVISMLRWRFAQRRDYRRSVSLHETVTDQEEDRLEQVDQCLAHVDPPSDLTIDLHDAIKSFDADMQNACRLLMHRSIAETARQLGLTRAEARTRTARIRRLLTGKGLDAYVKP